MPVFEKKLDNYEQLNKDLEKYIYDLQKNDPKGQIKSNSGGWHSPFFNVKNSAILQKFIASFSDYLYKVISGSGRENTRKFCPKCGSRVWAEIPDLNLASVSGFALEDRSHFKPTINYHIKQAPKWCLIDKKMTSYEEQEVLATDQSN